MSALIAHYDNTPFWIAAGTNNDDLECPIHLKVRLVDGTLDVSLLWVSDSTICIEWAGGPSPPSMWAADALFLCGS